MNPGTEPSSCELTAYEKMRESAAGWQLDEADMRAVIKAPWAVTEKIHGANFVVVTDGTDVRFGKRKALLAAGESFFGHAALAADLSVAALAIWRAVGAPKISIYGELFGGHYPHPEAPSSAGVQAIQTGVWYAPDVRYAVFDIATEDRERSYLGGDAVGTLCAEAGILAIPPLHVGTWEEATQFPLGFDSTIPALLGLPALQAPNLAEGVVLKPWTPLSVSINGVRTRPVLKRKIAAFAEDARYHGAQKWDVPSTPLAMPTVEWALLTRINGDRVAAVVSKTGEPRSEIALESIAAAVVDDAWNEIEQELVAEISCLDRDDIELLRSVAIDEARTLVAARPGSAI